MNFKKLFKGITQRNLESSGGINYRLHWVMLLIVFVLLNIGTVMAARFMFTSIDEGTFFVETHTDQVSAEALSQEQLSRVLDAIDTQQERFANAKTRTAIPENPF